MAKPPIKAFRERSEAETPLKKNTQLPEPTAPTVVDCSQTGGHSMTLQFGTCSALSGWVPRSVQAHLTVMVTQSMMIPAVIHT